MRLTGIRVNNGWSKMVGYNRKQVIPELNTGGDEGDGEWLLGDLLAENGREDKVALIVATIGKTYELFTRFPNIHCE